MTDTIDRLIDWPDTSDEYPPADWLYKSATWLLGRHPMLAGLAARCPGVVTRDPDDGELWLDRDLLAEGLRTYEEVVVARQLYVKRTSEPRDNAAYDAWEAAAPQYPGTPAGQVASEIACMSGSEKTRLRLLATFTSCGATIRVGDFGRLDDGGQALLADWLNAARVA